MINVLIRVMAINDENHPNFVFYYQGHDSTVKDKNANQIRKLDYIEL